MIYHVLSPFYSLPDDKAYHMTCHLTSPLCSVLPGEEAYHMFCHLTILCVQFYLVMKGQGKDLQCLSHDLSRDVSLVFSSTW
jgi:hypothetical protein